MLDPALDVLDGVPSIALVPRPIEVLGDEAKLDDEVGREVIRPDLAALFLPEVDQGLSWPMMMRASEPPMKEPPMKPPMKLRRFVESAILALWTLIAFLRFGIGDVM